jgi:hypothetical protein
MAVTKTIIKNTNQETVVKVGGTAGSATIDLQTDCLASTQALSGDTQTVNIISSVHTGLLNSAITVTRNAVPVLAIAAENNGKILLNDIGFVDTQENTSDIVVTIAGAEAHIYLTLRKVSGYATKVETAQFSIYDDTTKVGE